MIADKDIRLSEVQYAEKFIAFLDVLGWKSLVCASDKGCGLSLGELCEIMDTPEDYPRLF